MESTDLIPLSGDIAKITDGQKSSRICHEAHKRTCKLIFHFTMDALSGVHQRVKSSTVADATKQMVTHFLLRAISLT